MENFKHLQEMIDIELGLTNQNHFIFQHYTYTHNVPNIATVNKALKNLLEKMRIEPMITTKNKDARHTYRSYLWHNGIDLEI